MQSEEEGKTGRAKLHVKQCKQEKEWSWVEQIMRKKKDKGGRTERKDAEGANKLEWGNKNTSIKRREWKIGMLSGWDKRGGQIWKKGKGVEKHEI